MPKGVINSGIDHNKKIREFIESSDVSEFTERQIIDATGVSHSVISVFLFYHFQCGNFTRIKKTSNGRCCFHYSVSEKGLPKKSAGKGEIANLVWKILSEEYPRRLTTSEIRHNILLRVNCHPHSVNDVVTRWSRKGYLERTGNYPDNKYRLKQLLDRRPVARPVAHR